jgi:hypothetical protein
LLVFANAHVVDFGYLDIRATREHRVPAGSTQNAHPLNNSPEAVPAIDIDAE